MKSFLNDSLLPCGCHRLRFSSHSTCDTTSSMADIISQSLRVSQTIGTLHTLVCYTECKWHCLQISLKDCFYHSHGLKLLTYTRITQRIQLKVMWDCLIKIGLPDKSLRISEMAVTSVSWSVAFCWRQWLEMALLGFQ